MELKDVILSTLAEMEEQTPPAPKVSKDETPIPKIVKRKEETLPPEQSEEENSASSTVNELSYLKSLRERFLVLFEGFQAPNNVSIEAKIDMTLNFLEYVLATIDSRIQKIEKGKQE